MTDVVSDFIHAALQLKDHERAQIVDALVASLPANSGELSKAWRDEINRRSDALDKDPASVLPWEEVRADLWRSIGRE